MSKKSNNLEEKLAVSRDFIRGREPILCVLDVEVTPILAWTYQAYDGNILKIVEDPKVISVAWVIGENKKIEVRTIADYAGYKAHDLKVDDSKIVKDVYEMLQTVDVIIGQNLDGFDMKVLNARFVHYNLPPLERKVQIDTLKIARKYFRFPKNNLDELLRYLGIEKNKTKVKHSDVIWDCLAGDLKSWRAMARYNQRDVEITRDLYHRVKPYHYTHPNLNLIARKDNACPSCLSTRKKRFVGYRYNPTNIKKRYQCLDCKRYFTGEVVAQAPKREKVETETERIEQSN